MYKDLCKALPKMAVGLTTTDHNGETFYPVITQCSKVINFFNHAKSNNLLINNDEQQIITAYEITLDKIVTINYSDIKIIHWVGIPYEIPPGTYLLPQLSGYITDEQLFAEQKWFLERVKVDRDRGCFTDKAVPQELISAIAEVCAYFLSFVEETDYNNDILRFFKDWPRYKEFNLNRNLKDTLILLDLYKSMFFIPAVQACIGKELSIEDDLNKFIDKSIFIDLKDKWCSYLENTRVSSLEQKQKEIVQFENTSRAKLINVIKTGVYNIFTLFDSVKARKYKSFTLPEDMWNKFLESEGLVATDDNKLVYSNVMRMFGVPQEDIDALFEVIDKKEDVYNAVESMKNETDSIIEEYRHIKSQYDLVINKLANLVVSEELEGLDDYRLYLRYWPEYFDYNSAFHDNIRPFTEVEIYILKFFIREKIDFDLHSIYRFNSDYYNSIVDILDSYKNQVIEKRLEYIMHIAQKRALDIQKEMSDVELSEEEKVQFNDIIKDMTNIDKYRQELKEEKNLINILAYWPVALYPIPEDILQV